MERRYLIKLLLALVQGSQLRAQPRAREESDEQTDVLNGSILQTASKCVEQAAIDAVEVVAEMTAELERSINDLALAFGELIKADQVNRQIQSYSTFIDRAERSAFRRTLMRAVIFEEQVHEFPPFIESTLESWGVGDSVGPSQIRVSLWAQKYNTDRKRLLRSRAAYRGDGSTP